MPRDRAGNRPRVREKSLDLARAESGRPMRTLSNLVALGEVESLALPYESYTAASSDDLLAGVFAAGTFGG